MSTDQLEKRKLFTKLFIEKVKNDGISDSAAQLAYYVLLSLFPFLLFVITLIPYFPLEEDAIITLLNTYVPGETGALITDNVSSIMNNPRVGLLSFGLLATFWSSSNAIGALMRSINRAYDETELRSFLKLKITAIVLTIAMGFVVIITLLLPVFGRLILNAIEDFFYIPGSFTTLLNALRWVVGFTIMMIVLMFLYRIAPIKKVKLTEVFWGALIATISWQLISFGFSYYVTSFGNYSATYGTLGGVIVLMIWFYLTALILIVGGEVNATLYRMRVIKG